MLMLFTPFYVLRELAIVATAEADMYLPYEM
jgi:hypothetical protein